MIPIFGSSPIAGDLEGVAEIISCCARERIPPGVTAAQGLGKSVVATCLSAHFAMQGQRVLHVGCDPKHDSAVRLVDGSRRIRSP